MGGEGDDEDHSSISALQPMTFDRFFQIFHFFFLADVWKKLLPSLDWFRRQKVGQLIRTRSDDESAAEHYTMWVSPFLRTYRCFIREFSISEKT